MTSQSPTAVATERLKEILAGCETAPDNAWLIRKNGYFYRPNSGGYTASKAYAGRYTEEEAKALHAHSPRTITALPASEWPDEPYGIEPSELRAIVSELLASPRIVELEARIAELEGLVERLKLEAQIHAGEAKAANSTLYEIYQLCSGATGEKGNWNGAEPIRVALSTAEARGRERAAKIADRAVEHFAAKQAEAKSRKAKVEARDFESMRFAAVQIADGIRASALSTNEAGE